LTNHIPASHSFFGYQRRSYDQEDLYGNDPDDVDSDDDSDYDIEDKQDFSTVLQKVRAISKAATVTQKRILSFDSYSQAAKLKTLRSIRDHAIRWSATFNMMERAIHLEPAIDMWTRSEDKYEKLRMTERDWEMVEFLLRFLYPFMVASTTVQETASPSLSETWVVYEELFDSLDEAKAVIMDLPVVPEWPAEVQTAIEGTWRKLRKYYDKSSKPFAYVDATILHPALKNVFFSRPPRMTPQSSTDIRKHHKRDFKKNMIRQAA
jgi:predicted GIY-YIG superfamily endonuclease